MRKWLPLVIQLFLVALFLAFFYGAMPEVFSRRVVMLFALIMGSAIMLANLAECKLQSASTALLVSLFLYYAGFYAFSLVADEPAAPSTLLIMAIMAIAFKFLLHFFIGRPVESEESEDDD